MKTKRIKVTDLHTLQMEKQRLQMQIDFTEEKIIERVSTFAYEFPVMLITRILPFGLGEKQGVINGIKKVRSFITDNLISNKSGEGKNELYRIFLTAGKGFVVKMLGRMTKGKSS